MIITSIYLGLPSKNFLKNKFIYNWIKYVQHLQMFFKKFLWRKLRVLISGADENQRRLGRAEQKIKN